MKARPYDRQSILRQAPSLGDSGLATGMVLVVIVLMGLVLGGISAIFGVVSNQLQTVEGTREFQKLSASVGLVLADETTCALNFGSMDLTSPVVAVESGIRLAQGEEAVVKKDTIYHGVQVTGLEIHRENEVVPGSGLWSGSVVLTARRPEGAYGPLEQRKSLPAFFQTDASGKIVSCYAEASQRKISSDLCASLGGHDDGGQCLLPSCPQGHYAKSVDQNGQPDCQPVAGDIAKAIPSVLAEQKCKDNEMMVSVSWDGKIICKARPTTDGGLAPPPPAPPPPTKFCDNSMLKPSGSGLTAVGAWSGAYACVKCADSTRCNSVARSCLDGGETGVWGPPWGNPVDKLSADGWTVVPPVCQEPCPATKSFSGRFGDFCFSDTVHLGDVDPATGLRTLPSPDGRVLSAGKIAKVCDDTEKKASVTFSCINSSWVPKFTMW